MLILGQTAARPHKCPIRHGRNGLVLRHTVASHLVSVLRRPVHILGPASLQWSGRHVASANSGPSPSESTIKSLESILGSKDDEGSPPGGKTTIKPPAQHRRKRLPDAAERRVRPLYVYVIYYCYIVVYLATAWLRATDGDLAASTLVDGLVNDHLAVAAGAVPRLATAGFVCASPLELFLLLATLATVGTEAESLLGYSLFWAVYWLAGLGGGLADAAFSELPVTAGPANAVAGIVGALAAYYARNLGLEQRIGAARTAVRRRRGQILDGRGPREAGGEKPPLHASRDSLEDAEAEVEVLPLLPLTLTAQLSPEAKGLLNVLVALVVAGQGLLDYGSASSNASWIGLIAAFWTGLILTFGAGPQYEVQYTLPQFPRDGDDSNGSGSGSRGGGPAESAAGRGATAWPRRGGQPEADEDGLMVVDVCPPSRRRAVLGGYVVGLAGLICGWLAWMGADI